jgi:hypothetical protein
MDDGGVAVMARPKRKTDDTPDDLRVAAVVLKDTPEYRDWLTGLSEETLIPVATIVRDALAKWAADRGLEGPPGSATRSQRRIGDRGKKSTPKR